MIAKVDRVEVEAVEGAQRGMGENNDGSWSELCTAEVREAHEQQR